MGTFLRFFGISSSDDNRIDEATGLTEKQKKLVQNTWAVIRKDEVASGIAVMTTFFKTYPEYQRYFSAFADVPLDELPANKRFQAHCVSVITALSSVIDSLHDPGLMEASLISLGERHKKRGQTKEEFESEILYKICLAVNVLTMNVSLDRKLRYTILRTIINLKGVVLKVLSQALGKQYTPEVAEAWSKTLEGVFAKIYQVFSS